MFRAIQHAWTLMFEEIDEYLEENNASRSKTISVKGAGVVWFCFLIPFAVAWDVYDIVKYQLSRLK